MVYAIIETGGKQLRVEPGRFYDIDRLAVEEDSSVTIDQVLFIENDGDVSIGMPLVEGATVEGTVQRHFRGRKIIVYKMKPKKKTRKKRGHRQELTRLMINSISVNGTAIGGSSTASSPVADDVEPATAVVEPVEAVVEPVAAPDVVETEAEVEPVAVPDVVETEAEVEPVAVPDAAETTTDDAGAAEA